MLHLRSNVQRQARWVRCITDSRLSIKAPLHPFHRALARSSSHQGISRACSYSRRWLDPIAGSLLEPIHRLTVSIQFHRINQNQLVDTRVAIALEVILRYRSDGRRPDGNLDIRAFAPVGFQHLFEPPDLGRRLIQIHVQAVPSVAVLGGALQRRAALATEEHWEPGAMNWLGKTARALEAHEFAGMTAEFVAPQLAHGRNVIARTLRATLPWNTDRVKFLFEPADADAQDDSAFADKIQRGNHFA